MGLGIGLGFHEDDRSAPDDGGLVVVIQDANADWVLPAHFPGEKVACD